MLNVNKKIKLTPDNDLIEINVSQYDFNSRILKFNFYDGNKIFKPSEDTKIIIVGIKADGKKFAYEAENKNGVAVLPLQEQMTTTAGIVNCNIQLRLNDEILTTTPFVLNVKKVVEVADGELSQTEIPVFVELAKKEAEEARQSALKAEEIVTGVTESATIAKNSADKAMEVVAEVKKFADSSKANAESVLNEVEKIQEVANSINQNIEEVRTKTEQVATQATEVQRNHDEVSEWKTEIVQVRTDVQETKKQIENVNVHVDEVKQQIDTSETNVANISENVATNKKAVEQIKGDVEKLKERTSELNTQTEQTAVNINKKFDEIKEITASNVELKKNVETLKGETQNIRDNAKGVVEGVVIVNDEKGSYIAVNDSTNRELKGMRIYGKSWQDRTPTIEEPKEIHSVENAEVGIYGKNLFTNDIVGRVAFYPLTNKAVVEKFDNGGKDNMNYIKATYNTGKVSVEYMRLYKLTDNVKQYLSTTLSEKTVKAGFYYKSTENKNVAVQMCDDSARNMYAQKHVTIEKTNEWKWLDFEMKINKDVEPSNQYFRTAISENENLKDYVLQICGLQLSIDDPTYEPFKDGGTLTIPYKLNGVPVPKGGNYTDESGQDWIADYVDFEKGVLVKRCYLTERKKSEMQPYSTNDLLSDGSENLGATYQSNLTGMLCNYPCKSLYIWNGRSLQAQMTDRDSIPQDATIKWLIGLSENMNNVQEIPLLQDELNAYKQLMTQYPYTTILNDKGAFMDVKYVADTKNYIDNKFEELKKAIVFEKGSL